jgi:oligopeptide transport system ATP-binding protein
MTDLLAAPAVSRPEPVLEVTDVEVHFGRVQALRGVSLTVGPGEVLGLVGESGSGKSTLGRCVVGLLRPTHGNIRVGAQDITTMSRRDMRSVRKGAQIIFQDPGASLDPRIRIHEIVAEPLKIHRVGTSAEQKRAVERLLETVGLNKSYVDRYPHQLSGGQRQRVSVARALALSPKLLVADEPTSALDVSVQAQILNLMVDLQAEMSFSCLFITHDLSAVEYLADRIAVMYLGRIIEIGSRRDIFASAAHPYTQALLSAAPVADPARQRSRRRIVLRGDVPSPLDVPKGCAFASRCPFVMDICLSVDPELRAAERVAGAETPTAAEMDERHLSACHLTNCDRSAPDTMERTP